MEKKKLKFNMNAKVNFKKKIVVYTFLFFVLHLILQTLSPIYGLGYGLQVFDNPDRPDAYLLSLKSKISDTIFLIISFPVITILIYLFPYSQNWFNWFPFFGWTPSILNSLLWTLIFYFIIKRMYIKKYFNKN